jgi:hypothetical protein
MEFKIDRCGCYVGVWHVEEGDEDYKDFNPLEVFINRGQALQFIEDQNNSY